jgi:solute carrier family 25 oxoglutarate transporter 11
MLLNTGFCLQTFAAQLGGENSRTNLVVSSVVSGIAASVASLPFDLVKTRLQKMRPNADGTMPYKGFFDCTKQILANEGPLAFYKGLSTYIFRISPHVIITLIVLDYLNKTVDRLLLK